MYVCVCITVTKVSVKNIMSFRGGGGGWGMMWNRTHTLATYMCTTVPAY